MPAPKKPENLFLDRYNEIFESVARRHAAGEIEDPQHQLGIELLEEVRALARGEGQYGAYLRSLRQRRHRHSFVERAGIDALKIGETVKLSTPQTDTPKKIASIRMSIYRYSTITGWQFSVRKERMQDGYTRYVVTRLA